jgi:hypothetical protein
VVNNRSALRINTIDILSDHDGGCGCFRDSSLSLNWLN